MEENVVMAGHSIFESDQSLQVKIFYKKKFHYYKLYISVVHGTSNLSFSTSNSETFLLKSAFRNPQFKTGFPYLEIEFSRY